MSQGNMSSVNANAGNIARVDGGRLRRLYYCMDRGLEFNPQYAAKSAKAAEILSNKEFLVAQLNHYDVPFPTTAKMGTLREYLRDAVEEGQCDQVPGLARRAIEEPEHVMEPLDQQSETEVMFEEDDNPFAECNTPGEKAKCDIHRFLAEYFVDDGEPDPLITPDPVPLYGYRDRKTLFPLVEMIPGLKLISAGFGNNKTLCLGWDYSSLFDLQAAIEKEQKKPRQPFDLEKLIGSYDIESESLDAFDDPLSLNIDRLQNGVLMAAYDFGEIYGTMILSQSEKHLQDWAERNDNKPSHGSFFTPRGSRTGARPAVKQPPRSHRFFYMIRGRERGEDVIFYQAESGHLDILDNACTTFQGLAYSLRDLGSDVKFLGRKVSDAPNRFAEPWASLSERTYEFECRDRWRHR